MFTISVQVLFFLTIASFAGLLLLTNPNYLHVSAFRASSYLGGSTPSATPTIHTNNKGPVIQEIVNTGNSVLDKQVNKFYSCVSKVTHEPIEPLKDQVDNCYLQVFGTGSSNNGKNNYSPTTSSSKISSSPPGILVEVP
jgi:hypothetical protein